MQVVLDLDDFYEGNTSIELLSDLRSNIPGFKVNLFTIPGRCSPEFIRSMGAQDWINLIPHGWCHYTNYEVVTWDEKITRSYLKRWEDLGFKTKGFKAPGWQISDGCFRALYEAGYWVADQPYNRARRPAGLRVYEINTWQQKRVAGIVEERKGTYTAVVEDVTPYISIHGHIGHLNGHNDNALELIYQSIYETVRSLPEAKFAFIDDLLNQEVRSAHA